MDLYWRLQSKGAGPSKGGPQQSMAWSENAGAKIDNIVGMLMEYEKMTIDLM